MATPVTVSTHVWRETGATGTMWHIKRYVYDYDYFSKYLVYVDVDECALDLDGCPFVCENTYDGHECRCDPGYEGDGFTCTGKLKRGNASFVIY